MTITDHTTTAYSVTTNDAGCLPDNGAAIYHDGADAVAALAAEIDADRETAWCELRDAMTDRANHDDDDRRDAGAAWRAWCDAADALAAARSLDGSDAVAAGWSYVVRLPRGADRAHAVELCAVEYCARHDIYACPFAHGA
jgi:hypothetical protein